MLGGYLVIDLEHHVGELQHGVALDLCQGDDVVEVVQQLIWRLSHAAQVLTRLKLRTIHSNVKLKQSYCSMIQSSMMKRLLCKALDL